MDRLTSYTDACQSQPRPGPLAAGPRPTGPQAVMPAAVWRLAAWSPAATPGRRADFAHAGSFGGDDPVQDVAALLAEWLPAADDRGRALRADWDGDAEIGTVVLTGARTVAVLDVDVRC
ncbi:hypothetical protein ACQP2P_18100 [Dactylosporangium sp. CA-139114]|uniref:hypothetical protein n=1 Tax=Dactylosporangium sp. CA-139114 TaxID=3239931 RepID=UPI003D99BF15